ncbi:FAD-dependent oxidoreductase [Peptoniphilus lacrimalis DNF00528]|nr:FAD-dependent oxidoreductase [Peptoniphilus lacrimalis DNF00528]
MKIAVIGAGPSGMMAAFAAASNHEVTIFEKNDKLGKKLYITGKGRCNLTNYVDASDFFKNVISNKKFVYSSIYSFDPFMTMDLFNSYGLQLKVERGNRVFPMSDKASDVIKTYEKMLKERNVKIFLNTLCKTIDKKDKFIINGKYIFDKVIIATGGISYKETGSTGDGYKFAEKFNIKSKQRKQALCGALTNEPLDLSGLSLKNVEVLAYSEGKLIAKEFGEMLFTHIGVSGPIILTLSSKINRMSKIKLYLDLKPGLTYDELDKRILRDFDKFPNKDIRNALINLLPRDLIFYVLKKSNISSYKKVNQITGQERDRLKSSIKKFDLDYKCLEDINRAIITSGGISVDEINPHTMESKKVKGLYFVGEVLDIDALTGGFNIQLANSTAYLCGSNI